MNATTKRRQQIVEALDGIPFDAIEITGGRTHLKVYVESNGKRRFIVTGSTPSCWRADRKLRSQAKRVFQQFLSGGSN